MSFYHLPNPWNPGYAIPKYVLAEPLGRGTFTTKWLPRGTISALPPDFLAKPAAGQAGELKRTYNVEPLGSLGGDTLDAERFRHSTRATGAIDVSRPGFRGDPIKAYGQRASEWIMSSIGEVTPSHRKIALRALLDGVDKSLWITVEQRATKYRGRGMGSKRALQKSLAISMSNGLAKEMVDAGAKAMAGHRSPVKHVSLMGLGMYEDSAPTAYYQALDVMQQLGFGWGDLNPVKHVKSAASAIGRGATSATGAVWSGAKAVGSGASWAGGKVWDGTKWVGGKVEGGASSAANWVGKGLGKLGDLACAVANSAAAPMAAGAAAAATGAPPQVGAAGANIAAGMCASGKNPGVTQTELNTPTGGGMPGWLLPVGIGAAALAAVVILKK